MVIPDLGSTVINNAQMVLMISAFITVSRSMVEVLDILGNLETA
jgi:hypothetical protein